MDSHSCSTYAELRVSDISDAMDKIGHMGRGHLNAAIRPLYRDLQTFSHRIAGPAVTVRYLPTQAPLPPNSPEAWEAYESQWRRSRSPSFASAITPGCVVVIDAAEMDVGFIGSSNCLHWLHCGAAGIVTNGGARDTDELILQKCPVYSQFISRTFKPGRLELQAINEPINCGGVTVRPGDLIVADGDGVICVPQSETERVVALARAEHEKDRLARREHYQKLGLEFDSTVLAEEIR